MKKSKYGNYGKANGMFGIKRLNKDGSNYKHGLYCQETHNYCIDCGIEISKGKHDRCKDYAYKHRKQKYYCKICGKEVTKKTTILCQKCYIETMVPASGKNANAYIDGRSLVKHYCIDCGKEISYRSKRCKKCSNTGINAPRYGIKENLQHKKRRIAKIVKSIHQFPNKTEQLLDKFIKLTLPKEYKFVGNGKVIIDGFNPDFININGKKKIIELYGDYWHNLPGYMERDKRRLKSYKKYGYKTLIIWEHELKEPEKVIAKVMEFNL